MGMYTKIILVVLFSYGYRSIAQENYVLLSLNDCINCTANLYNLQTSFSDYNWKIVMQSADAVDSTDIVRKYKLDPGRIVWSDSLYNVFSDGTASRIVVTLNENFIKQYPLKDAVEVLTLLKNNEELESIDYGIGNRVLYSFYNNDLIITNRLSMTLDIYKNGKKKHIVSYQPDFAENAYKINYGQEFQPLLDKYQQDYSKVAALEPQIVKHIMNNDSTIDLLTYCYIYEGDTARITARKLYSVVTYNYVTRKTVSQFNLSSADPDYAISEGCFYKNDKGRYYLSVVKIQVIPDTTVKLKFIGAASKDKKDVLAVYPLDITLPDIYIEKKCYYNVSDPFISYPMVVVPISNKLFDIEKNVTYTLPFDESILIANDPMNMTDRSALKFHIFDISYDKQNQIFNVIYFKKNNYYLLKYNVAIKKTEYDETILNIPPDRITYRPGFDKKNFSNILLFTRDKKLHTYLAY